MSITDDDVPTVSVSFEQASYTVAEGSSVSVKVVLDADPERTVTIPITRANQGGASSSDYSGVPRNLSFNSGDTEQTITFSAATDGANDDGESVKLGFGTLPTGVSAGSTNESVVSITDDDLPSVNVSFEQASYTVAEGSSVAVKVKLDADPERTVTIPITKNNQDGATNSDYSGVPNNVTFNSGDTERTITFSAAIDGANDDGESVKLGFGTLPTGVSEGSTNESVVSITDDDLPSVNVSFEQASYAVAEGSSVSVKVKLSADPERTVTIPITKTNQDGASNSDYTGVPASVVFDSGDTEKTITFSAATDGDDDDGESVKLGFGNLPTGVSEGSTNEATIQLMNTEAGTCDNEANKTIVLDEIGEISQSGESGFWTIKVDPYRSYLIEVIGVDGRDLLGEDNHPGQLTLEDPDVIAIWNAKRSSRLIVYSSAVDDRGYGKNSVAGYAIAVHGTRQIEVASGDGGTGTYQIKVRVNNVCRVTDDGEVQYPWAGGPDGYNYKLDIRADTSTDRMLLPTTLPHRIELGEFLGNNWDSEPDEDWWGAELETGYEYTVELYTRTKQPETHQATQLKILGIHDMNGTVINGTASSGSGKSVSVVFRPDSTDRYYISVGSEGEDRTGTYHISVTKTAIN